MMNRHLLLAVISAAMLSACAADSTTRNESPIRRDNWYVQTVRVSVNPDRFHAWCLLENEHFSVSVHSVPGVAIVPVRGNDLKASCHTQRGWVGTRTVARIPVDGRQPARGTYPSSRSEASWPEEIVVDLQPDRRIEEVRERELAPRPATLIQPRR